VSFACFEIIFAKDRIKDPMADFTNDTRYVDIAYRALAQIQLRDRRSYRRCCARDSLVGVDRKYRAMSVANLSGPQSALVLCVANLFHPIGSRAVEIFLNGDVCHGCGWRGAVPMFLTRRDRDHVPRPNLLNRTTPGLHPTAASRNDQGLAQRMGVPCCPSTGLERNTGTARACWIVWLKQGVNTYSAGEIVGRPFAGGL
jgi:hypothetical protein